MHSLLPFLITMVAAVVLLEMMASKLKVAYPILLVLAGLLLGFIPGLPTVKVNPDLIFFLFLPPLLFEAAWTISFKEMKKWWRIIGSFAFLVVLFTALSVAVITNYLIPGFSLALGFLLGGIVSPPDAVSTGAIVKFVKIPKSTSTILEGESLLNDASSLIIVRFALMAVATGQFIWQQAALNFLWMVIGGAGIGLLLAWFFVQAHKRLPTDAPSDIALTLIEPYFMYWVAEQLHSSGVLAVVSGGLFMANRRLLFLNSSSRISAYNVWESFVFILNGIVFLIIGLQLPEIVQGLRANGIPLGTAIRYSLIVTATLIVVRIISSYLAMLATSIFRPNVARNITISIRRRLLLPILLGWTGMRGVVSLAAALAIPVALNNGSPFPYRNLILFITFVAILLTLLVQGLTLPYFINRFGGFANFNGRPDVEIKQEIKQKLRVHIHQFLKSKETELHDYAGMQLIMKHWDEKSKAVNDEWMDEKTKVIFIELLESQRQYLAELNRDPEMDEDIIRRHLFQIDLEEERVKLL